MENHFILQKMCLMGRNGFENLKEGWYFFLKVKLYFNLYLYFCRYKTRVIIMIVIHKYYRSDIYLQNSEEPYKSLASIVDTLYLKRVAGNYPLSYSIFDNIIVVNCMRTLAEKLAKNSVTFIKQLQTQWNAVLNPKRQYTIGYFNFSVPYEYYQGVIFGGVYYVLAKQKLVDIKLLDCMETFVSEYPAAVPYFDIFKNALKSSDSSQGYNSACNQSVSDLPIKYKQKEKSCKEVSDDKIINELKSCFFGKEQPARDFLEQIKAVNKDAEKPTIAFNYFEQKKLSEMSMRRTLWGILHKYQLYSKSEGNWNTMLRKLNH